MPRLAGDELGAGHALILALVGERRATHHVADGVDARDGGAEMLADLDPAALVELDPRLRKTEPIGHRPSPDRDEHTSAAMVVASPPAAGSTVSVTAFFVSSAW